MNRSDRRVKLWFNLLFIAALAFPPPALGFQKRPIAETDLFKFVWISDPQISPDGSRVAFVRVWVNQKADRYESALWIVGTTGGAARQLTAGPRDTGPRWSPDGKRLAFIRTAEREGRPNLRRIYLLTFEGGEAQPLTEMPRGAGGFYWSPDGKTIAFTSTEELGSKDKAITESGELKEKQPERSERVSDVRVINKATYRSNGPGYLNPKVRSHIWTIGLAGNLLKAGELPKPVQITKGKFDEGNISWSRDSSRIFFISRRVAEPYYETPRTDLFSVAPDGSDEKKLLTFEGGMRDYTFSDDGKRIAFAGSITHKPVQSYTQPGSFCRQQRGRCNAEESDGKLRL